MLVLAMDTATPAVTAGVVELAADDVRLVGAEVTVDPRAHGELLTPHALAAATEAGHALADLDALVCGVGPGPFTGLRAGMATAAALGHALSLPVYPVCSLDAIAEEVPRGAPFRVLTDARRREVYWAGYDAHGTRVSGPDVTAPAELAASGIRAAGDGARLYAEVLGDEVLGPRYPTPAGLVRAAAAALRAGTPPGPLTPLYLRRPDATVPGTPKKVTA